MHTEQAVERDFGRKQRWSAAQRQDGVHPMKASFGFHVASGLWWARAGELCRMTCWGTSKEQAQRKLRRFLERFRQTALEWRELEGPGPSEAPPDESSPR